MNPDRGNLQIVAPRRQDRHQRGRVRVDREEIVRLRRRRERGRRKRLEHVAGRHRDAGIDQHRGQFGQSERVGQDFADAAHHARLRIETDRHVGAGDARRFAHALVVERKIVQPRQQPQRGRRVRRSAAKSGRDGQELLEPEPAEPQSVDTFGERTRRLEHEIVAVRARRVRGRAGHVERKRVAGSKCQPVADIGERHQAFELVIAVRPAAEHMQREIDLGGRELRQIAGAWPSRMDQPPLPGFLPALAVSAGCASSISPVRSFSSIFLRSSGSGLRSRACAHWNVASSVRPTFQ